MGTEKDSFVIKSSQISERVGFYPSLFTAGCSSEEEFVVSENESEPETDGESNNSDYGSNGSGKHRTSSWTRNAPQRRRSSRKRRRPKGYSDDEEDETDEEDEDEIGM